MSIAAFASVLHTVKSGLEIADKIKSIAEVKEVAASKATQMIGEAVEKTKKGEIPQVNSVEEVPQRLNDICKDGENVEWPCAPNDGLKVAGAAAIINDTSELKPQNWEQLTVDQKREVLQGVENQLADATNRPACEVVFEKMEDNLNGYNLDGKIALNVDRLEDSSPEGIRKILTTLVHEGRHEYQNFNLQLVQMGLPPVEPNLEKVEAWWINMIELGYESGESSWFDFKKLGLKKYYTQPVEVDARVFAADVLDNVTIIK